MKIAFVGVKRSYREFSPEYARFFNKYHLELPFYYAEFGGNEVTLVTADHTSPFEEFSSGGRFRTVTEDEYTRGLDGEHDVVIHWRSWHAGLRQVGALNLMHTCDHSYSPEWVATVTGAFQTRQLYGILCHPTWHRDNLSRELNYKVPTERLFSSLTSGVDTDVFRPRDKNPHMMLWASDPGRGLFRAVQLAIELYRRDKSFRLHVCHPDYVKLASSPSHPAVVFRGFVPNGLKLWDLFNSASFFPYTSTFMEPSSRAYRQAQSSGQVVLYPPKMGSPSDIINDGVDGFVRPVSEWNSIIERLVASPHEFSRVSDRARIFALSESWRAQSKRFNDTFIPILQESR